MDKMAKSKTVFVCSECGNESSKWLGKCPACNSWNTFYEQKVVETKIGAHKDLAKSENKPQKLNSYEAKETLRTSTGFGELDRVLGGGLVKGSLVLLGGEPGIGKSTLIKLIYNELKDRNDIKVGYMPQTYDDILNNYKYVLDFICPNGSKDEITKARMFLGNMKFTREEMTGKIKDLSNGTKAKLFLMKLVLDKCNVLVLDEPTRNVSPLSNPVIRKVLKEFSGTIISVSHDRKYIEEVVDSLYLLTIDGLRKIDNVKE